MPLATLSVSKEVGMFQKYATRISLLFIGLFLIELWAALQKANISGRYISYHGGHSYSGLTQANVHAA